MTDSARSSDTATISKTLSKIHFDHLPSSNQPNSSAIQKASYIIKELGLENVESLIFANNWSCNDLALSTPPSGFTLTLKNSTPVKTDQSIFPDHKMFTGTSVAQLKQSDVDKNLHILNPQWFFQNDAEVKSRINAVVKQYDAKTMKDRSPTKETRHENQVLNDSKSWTPSLNGNGAYVGIYSSKRSDGYKYEWEYYVVCQSGLRTVSEEIVRMLEKSEERKETFQEFLATNNTDLTFFQNICRRNRERIMANFCDAIGLKIDYDFDQSAVTEKGVYPKSLPSIIETTTNRFVTLGNKCVYHCGTTDPSTVKGMVFNQTPYLGPLIIRGANPSEKLGGTWSLNPNKGYYPTCTGRLVTVAPTSAKFKSLAFPEKKYLNPFSWEASTTETNLRLKLGLYRGRDSDFIKYERSLGLDTSSDRIISLEPLHVKLSSSIS